MYEQIDFDKKGVIVTGGAGDIGQATVREFANEGANVVIADIDIDKGQGIADEFDRSVRFVETNVSDYEACRDCVETTIDEFGRLDVLVNGATSRRFPRSERFQAFGNQSESHWEALIDVTFRGTINMTHCALPALVATGDGAVVNITSESRRGISNLSVGDTTENTLYASVKAGLTGFTAALANETGREGVRINAVSPGTVRTQETEAMLEDSEEELVEMIPLDRVGEPEDCANLILFLASDAASWITGQTVSVNGGYL